MIIKTKICMMSKDAMEFDRLGIKSKNRQEYEESDFLIDLNSISGIDAPSKDDPDHFVIFLQGTHGCLVRDDYDRIVSMWKGVKDK